MWKCPNCAQEFKNENRDHSCAAESPIGAYIAEQPEEIRPILRRLHEIIRAVEPALEEKIAWQMPTYRLKKNIIHFAAHKNHLGIYPGPDAIAAFSDRLGGYKSSKGAFQIPYTKEIDPDLITDLVRWNLEKLK